MKKGKKTKFRNVKKGGKAQKSVIAPNGKEIGKAYLLSIFVDNENKYGCACDVPDEVKNGENFMIMATGIEKKRDNMLAKFGDEENLHCATTEVTSKQLLEDFGMKLNELDESETSGILEV